jgi:hypothetical protein
VSDEELREASRDSTREGTIAARARTLHVRRRHGLVTDEQLRLASFCGDRAAQELVGLLELRDLSPWAVTVLLEVMFRELANARPEWSSSCVEMADCAAKQDLDAFHRSGVDLLERVPVSDPLAALIGWAKDTLSAHDRFVRAGHLGSAFGRFVQICGREGIDRVRAGAVTRAAID